MTSEKKQREFWVVNSYGGYPTACNNLTEALITQAAAEDAAGERNEIIHAREVLPDEISDTERLEWMIENEYYVSCDFYGKYGVYQQIHEQTDVIIKDYKSAIEAIDAAMKEQK